MSPERRNGRRTWWAHFEFTRINIEPIILRRMYGPPLIRNVWSAPDPQAAIIGEGTVRGNVFGL
jgi:hypothetical protein